MLTHTKQLLLLVIVLFMMELLISCKSEPTLAPPGAPGIVIGITDEECPSVIAKVGDQVTWTNQGEADHFVKVMDEGVAGQFSSGILTPGDSFSMTFSEPITYTYVCSTDESVKGIVTVNP